MLQNNLGKLLSNVFLSYLQFNCQWLIRVFFNCDIFKTPNFYRCSIKRAKSHEICHLQHFNFYEKSLSLSRLNWRHFKIIDIITKLVCKIFIISFPGLFFFFNLMNWAFREKCLQSQLCIRLPMYPHKHITINLRAP